MRKSALLVASLLVVACHGSDPATSGTGSESATSTTPKAPEPGSAVAQQGSGSGSAETKPEPTKPPEPKPPEPLAGHEFLPEAKVLLAVAACADNIPPPDNFSKKLLTEHCEGTKKDPNVKKAQRDYLDNWVKPASAFFVDKVPKDIPKVVVYPFAGGDLSTALTVYPDAEEITTMSLEPAGDPRDMAYLKGGELEHAMDKAAYELKFLYRVNFSNTVNMKEAMRQGALPTELIFALSALSIRNFEVTSLRYFDIGDDGTLHYLDDADIAKIPTPDKATSNERRNNAFSNMEIQFNTGDGKTRVYRHIRQDLDDDHLKKVPGLVKYLEARGDKIAAMTKAASYLLSFESFSTIRNYLLNHVVWMVSDATGIAPKWGKPANFEYETYGTFDGSHLDIGKSIQNNWRTEFKAEPKRDLPFRFGYYDVNNKNHLIIIKKKA
jgi:hypothetical protein